jgi:hypothetical protein
MDQLYPQKNGDPRAVRTQLLMQLADPPPFDLDEVELEEYKGVQPPFHQWSHVAAVCGQLSDRLLNACVDELKSDPTPSGQQAGTKIDSWRDDRASGKATLPSKPPGLET